jgi:hypothetical protein
MAAGIPGARFVSLDSYNNVVLGQEPTWREFLTKVRTFLGGAPRTNVLNVPTMYLPSSANLLDGRAIRS